MKPTENDAPTRVSPRRSAIADLVAALGLSVERDGIESILLTDHGIEVTQYMQNASGGFVEGRNGELRRTVKHFSYDAQVTTA